MTVLTVPRQAQPGRSKLGIGRWRKAATTVRLLLSWVQKRLLSSATLNPVAGRAGAKHSSYLAKLRQGAKAAADAHLTMAEGVLELVAQGRVVHRVQNEEELAAVPLWLQGNVELHTSTALAERSELRRHPRVLAALEELWEATLRSVQQHGSTARELDFEGYRCRCVLVPTRELTD